MTIKQALQQSTLDNLDAELLLAFILKTERPYIKAHPEQKLRLLERLRFFWYVQKRKANTPIAYLTKHKEFFGLDFEVNKHTLVPRPETEQMVSLVLDQIRNLTSKTKHVVLVDIGTGSGCIPISIAKTMVQSNNVTILASDISKPALTTAKRNTKTHAIDITFAHGNLLAPITNILESGVTAYDSIIITANLPYITEEQFADEPSIKREPHSALVAKEHGLALYRELLEQLICLKTNTPTTLYFEIDPTQEDSVQTLIREYYTESTITIHYDLCTHARIVAIQILPK